MINKVKIKDVASYDTLGINLELEKINYIYGSNGTGKTTISEFLRSRLEPGFSSCNAEYENSDTDTFVYNRHFVDENFNMNNEIKGIFTLGKASSDILEDIEIKQEQIKNHKDKVKRTKESREEKKQQLNNLKDEFTEKCWNLKLKYDEQFKQAFTGLRNNRQKFMQRCLDEAKENNGSIYTYEALQKRVESVYQKSQNKYPLISKIEYNISLEKHPIFQTKIIGKEDIDIAELIIKLNISDWVQQGQKHMENSEGICPFCQQELNYDFKRKLDEYFDETYNKQLHQLASSINTYEQNTLRLIEGYEYLKGENLPYFHTEKAKNLLEVIHSTYEKNKQLLHGKKNEPSKTIQLSSIKSYIEKINELIDEANVQIAEHNRIFDNFKNEKKQLNKDIWCFIVKENESNYQTYSKQAKSLNKAIKGMTEGIKRREGHSDKIEEEVIELQNDLTSVLPSINEINNLLKSFGFTNFSLAESEEAGNYKIVREDGKDAGETLSEGEKTFITFLYFYQLINGSNNQDKVNTERVIVIDDPISSLDSNILFIVSNLINNLKKKIRSSHSIFKQLIVLTHNVYFHKEISFNKNNRNQKQGDETFWILRKVNNTTQIKEYENNPIKNSYELLWKELKENPNSITTPNIMRRILENYFKFFGSIDIDEIVDEFIDEDKIVCNSLLSWVNDGSHNVNDDLYVDSNQELNEKYFNVFKKIFIESNHGSHFKMMMGSNQELFENATITEDEGENQEALDQVAASLE